MNSFSLLRKFSQFLHRFFEISFFTDSFNGYPLIFLNYKHHLICFKIQFLNFGLLLHNPSFTILRSHFANKHAKILNSSSFAYHKMDKLQYISNSKEYYNLTIFINYFLGLASFMVH